MRKGFLAVAFTRDRHPPDHSSFTTEGGDWPVHCVDGSPGFEIIPEIFVPPGAFLVDKGVIREEEHFDGFHKTDLGERFRERGVRRVFVVGLATEYCVKATVLGALREGFETWAVVDAIAGVNQKAGDCDRALVEMHMAGAELSESGQAVTMLVHQPHPSGLVVVDMQRDFYVGGALAVPDCDRVVEPIRRLLAYSRSAY